MGEQGQDQAVGLPAAEARRLGRSAGLLSIGVGTAGVLSYAYFALASRLLDKEEYGEIVVLWSLVFLLAATIFRPVEQMLTRAIAEHASHGQPIARPLRIAVTIQVSVAAAFMLLALVFRAPLEDELLAGDSLLYWTLVGSIATLGANFLARGFLAGSGRFTTYATLLVTDAVLRLMFALAVAVGIASGEATIALGIAIPPVLGLIVVPISLRISGASVGGLLRPGAVPEKDGALVFTLAHGGGFAAGVFLIMLSEQVLLNVGPLVIRGTLGVAAAGFIFNVLMVARAPLVLFQAMSTSLLPHLMRLRSRGGHEGQAAFDVSMKAAIASVAVFTAVVVLVIAAAGPQLMQLAFGTSFTYERTDLLIVAGAMGMYLTATALNQAALARGQTARAAAAYVFCAAGFVVFTLLPVMGDFRRVEVGLLLATTVLCALLYLIYRSAQEGSEPVAIHPGGLALEEGPGP